ncbi:MAG: DUF362 domain-containing protein [Spirochaetes bacterium]|nr:DUF362 domain-containing protein [Spirochaetota bacterium]
MNNTATISRKASDVALLSCPDYGRERLDGLIREAAEAAGFPEIGGKRILVKPNILKAAVPEKAVCTHPEFLGAVLRFLKSKGAARIVAGDSPAWQGGRAAAKTSGLFDAASSEGVEWVELSTGEARQSPGAHLVRGFALAAALDDCDLVVNLPKLKTHRLMKYTGAIKNLFGLVPSLGKSGFHLRFPDSADFGTMLVDLAASVPHCFTFMDGIVAMEGEGPGDGDPYALGIILASSDLAALDWTAASCIGYDPCRIPYLVDALQRTGRDPEKPSIEVGPRSVAELAAVDFRLLPYEMKGQADIRAIPSFARSFLKKILADRPIFDPRRCESCSACVKVCPAKALELRKENSNRILIDDEACIGCFCCHEVCPAHAIRIGKVLRRPGKARKLP